MTQIGEEAKRQAGSFLNTSKSPPSDRERYFRQSGLIDRAGIPGKFKRANASQLRGAEWLDRQADIIKQLNTGIILSLIGNRGTGKTRMACECIYEYIERHSKPALYLTAMDFFVEVKDSYQTSMSEQDILSRMTRPGLLVIDEVQERGQTEWEDRLLTHMINKRYAGLKDTILISNQTKHEFSESIGTSIASRMKETGGIIVCDWPSFR